MGTSGILNARPASATPVASAPMPALRSNPWFRAIAVVAPLTAVAPVVLGLSGGWVALHLIGGATSLIVLVTAAALLPSPWRWYAAAAVLVSVIVIAVVTDGGSIATPVQVAMFFLLGGVYVACVFWTDPRQPSS